MKREILKLAGPVGALLMDAGLSSAFTLSLMKGGGNNRVWKLKQKNRLLLLKQYFHHRDDPRDRFGTERAFYEFLQAHRIPHVPSALAWDATNHLALFEFIEGRKLLPGEVSRKRLDEAMEFFFRLNRHTETAPARLLAPASEACFSVAAHLDRIQARVRRLEQIKASSTLERSAARFVAQQLKPSWERVRDTIWLGERKMDRSHKTLLPVSARRLSPSDFGFHNALVSRGGKLHFFDFEYAGWDDPAKTACDFFCQRAVPVPFRFWPAFLKGLARGDPSVKSRSVLLLPAYRIKWCCIMLNEFVPMDRARRRFANVSRTEVRKASQLALAQKYLSNPG